MHFCTYRFLSCYFLQKKLNGFSWGGHLKLGDEETLNELFEKYIRSTKKGSSIIFSVRLLVHEILKHDFFFDRRCP